MLINAIYFKANWRYKFNERQTRSMKFNVRNGLEVNYPHGMNMIQNLRYADMTRTGFPAKVLELPYENENFRMLLILPNNNINIENLNLRNLDYGNLESRLRM